MANYPNPFNPETWIPYQLSKSADVSLTIYDIQGRVVCALDLGHQRAGTYQTRTRAAYWDGRNAQGELVASGVYFYTLTAGDFSATRKMLIQTISKAIRETGKDGGLLSAILPFNNLIARCNRKLRKKTKKTAHTPTIAS